MRRFSLPRPWVGPALVAFAFFVLLAVRAGAGDGFRYVRVIQAGDRYARPGVLLPGQSPVHGTGYDGQFAFYIGGDPFLRNSDTARSLDNSLRYRRILYPLLAWLLSAGQRTLLPYVLMAINVAASTVSVGLAAWAAHRRGRSPWFALVLPAFAGVWVPVLSDLTEPTQLAFLAAGALTGSAALTLLAALAKETAGVALAVEAARAAVARNWPRLARFAAAAVLLAAWSLFVQRAIVGPHENTLGGHLLDPPGAPFLVLVRSAGEPVRLVLTAAAVAVCLAAVLRLVWHRDSAAWWGAGYAVLALAAGDDTWRDPVAFYRVMAGAVLLLFLSWAVHGDRIARWALIASAVTGLFALVPVLLLSR
jgi:hypothetical protein